MELADVYQELDTLGVTVVEVDSLKHRGAYDHARKRVYLRRGMTSRHIRAVLLHELHHVRRGDDGHQDRKTEQHINALVTRELISVEKYRAAEQSCEGSVGALAVELDVPVWVVREFQRQITLAGQTVP